MMERVKVFNHHFNSKMQRHEEHFQKRQMKRYNVMKTKVIGKLDDAVRENYMKALNTNKDEVELAIM